MTTPVIPPVFQDFDVIEGFDPVDKATLVGVPFGITAVRFRTSERSVVFAEVEIINADGEPAAMIDSSSGVRDQLRVYMHGKNMDVSATTEWQDVRLFVPNGLRVSEYEVKDERGQDKHAKTYYLTTKARTRR